MHVRQGLIILINSTIIIINIYICINFTCTTVVAGFVGTKAAVREGSSLEIFVSTFGTLLNPLMLNVGFIHGTTGDTGIYTVM